MIFRPATPAADPKLDRDDLRPVVRGPAYVLVSIPPDIREWVEERAGHCMAWTNVIVVVALRHTMAADLRHDSGFDRDLVGEAG